MDVALERLCGPVRYAHNSVDEPPAGAIEPDEKGLRQRARACAVLVGRCATEDLGEAGSDEGEGVDVLTIAEAREQKGDERYPVVRAKLAEPGLCGAYGGGECAVFGRWSVRRAHPWSSVRIMPLTMDEESPIRVCMSCAFLLGSTTSAVGISSAAMVRNSWTSRLVLVESRNAALDIVARTKSGHA